jgi:thioesterase domain-containing protein
MTPQAMTDFLHREVPLTAAMGVHVLRCMPDEVELAAPLAPNLNLHGTAFAGSLATLGLISGWTVLNRALSEAQLQAHLVAQKSECTFLAPATQELRGIARLPAGEWARFVTALQHKGRARISVVTEIHSGETLVVSHTGIYAAKR